MPVGRLLVCMRNNMLHLVDLSLLPRFRGNGIGTQLMTEILEEARNARVPVKVKVRKESGAIRFVERLGFGTPTDLGTTVELTWMPPLTALGPDAREDGFSRVGTRAHRPAPTEDSLLGDELDGLDPSAEADLDDPVTRAALEAQEIANEVQSSFAAAALETAATDVEADLDTETDLVSDTDVEDETDGETDGETDTEADDAELNDADRGRPAVPRRGRRRVRRRARLAGSRGGRRGRAGRGRDGRRRGGRGGPRDRRAQRGVRGERRRHRRVHRRPDRELQRRARGAGSSTTRTSSFPSVPTATTPSPEQVPPTRQVLRPEAPTIAPQPGG